MAIFKASRMLEHITGKRGGMIYYQRRCSNQVLPVPPLKFGSPTPKQKLYQRAFKQCHIYLQLHATYYFVASWQDYANRHPKTNRKGEVIILAWHNMFFSYNIRRVINGLPIQGLPPGY